MKFIFDTGSCLCAIKQILNSLTWLGGGAVAAVVGVDETGAAAGAATGFVAFDCDGNEQMRRDYKKITPEGQNNEYITED